MTSPNDTYTSPLATRNASPEMLRIWSPRHKFNTWRRIWLAVAEAMHEVTKDDGAQRAPSASSGAPSGASDASGPLVTREQVDQLRAVVERGITDEEIARAAELERDLRHDVMAHVHCLGEQAPKARPIIHLGMTSQDVVCNADLRIINDAWFLIEAKCHRVIASMGDAAARTKQIATLGFTHYQTAQPTTVGRRIAGWAYELHYGATHDRYGTKLRGFKGATGTQASFLRLFDGGDDRVIEFESEAIARLLDESVSKIVDEWYRYHKRELQRRAVDCQELGRHDNAERLRKEVESLPDAPPEEFVREARTKYVSRHTFDLTGQT